MWADEHITNFCFSIEQHILIYADCSLLPTRTQGPEPLCVMLTLMQKFANLVIVI
jgi:hypothetical protein